MKRNIYRIEFLDIIHNWWRAFHHIIPNKINNRQDISAHWDGGLCSSCPHPCRPGHMAIHGLEWIFSVNDSETPPIKIFPQPLKSRNFSIACQPVRSTWKPHLYLFWNNSLYLDFACGWSLNFLASTPKVFFKVKHWKFLDLRFRFIYLELNSPSWWGNRLVYVLDRQVFDRDGS